MARPRTESPSAARGVGVGKAPWGTLVGLGASPSGPEGTEDGGLAVCEPPDWLQDLAVRCIATHVVDAPLLPPIQLEYVAARPLEGDPFPGRGSHDIPRAPLAQALDQRLRPRRIRGR